MITEIVIPQVSANITEATVIAWMREEGEAIAAGEILAELSTEKDNIEIESPVAGTLRRILSPVKSTVPVGYIIALVGDAEAPLPDVAEKNAAVMANSQERGQRSPRASRRPGGRRARVRATPAARRLARELGIDLAEASRTSGAEVLTEAIVRELAGNQT
jgi:pyruvate/2-oxoglutarate dehydrogenase complex dihydrolipoamide acyltransferase (E2) component